MEVTTERVTMQMLPDSVARLIPEVTADNGGEVPSAYRVAIYPDSGEPRSDYAWALVAAWAGRVGVEWGADMAWGDLGVSVDESIAALL